MDDTNRMRRRVVTLPAGVETDLLFDSTGMDTDTASSLEVAIDNDGPDAVDTITRYETIDGVVVVDPNNYGPILAGPGTSAMLPFGPLGNPVAGEITRLTATSVNGTVVTVAARAMQR